MQRVTSMMSFVVSEGRLCALKPSEWSLLLAGVGLCGVLLVLFLHA
jgi:hypothetical protein